MLVDHGSELGLWTQSALTNQPDEVASGVRVRKTDVAWVGPGYRYALDACDKARDGIEQYSTDRATVLDRRGLGRHAALRRDVDRRPVRARWTPSSGRSRPCRLRPSGQRLHDGRRRRHLRRQRGHVHA